MLFKRYMLLSVLMVMAVGAGFGQLIVEADLGVLLTLEDIENANLVGFPFLVGVGYAKPFSSDEAEKRPDLATWGVVVGSKIGYVNNILSLEGYDSDFELALSTVPFFVYGRAEWKMAFAELGLGVHAWRLDWSLEDEKGFDGASYFSSGVSLPVADGLIVLTGLRIMTYGFSISDFLDVGADDVAGSSTIGWMVGASYALE